MIAHFVICVLGSADLLELAIASVHKFAGDATLDLIQLPDSAYGNAFAHGRALDQWRTKVERDPIPDEDVVVLMDPDTAILSPHWRVAMERAFALFPQVGVWGAGCTEDMGRRIHPSMMAIRGKAFNTLTATFRDFHRPTDTEWLDTGGWYCKCAEAHGWQLFGVERALGFDWHGAAAWYREGSDTLRHLWDHEIEVTPMWVHLGGGTHSDPARLNWWQRLRRRQAIAKRRRFIEAVKTVLAVTPSGPQSIA